jgi:aldehyde dehydrogenase family protein
VLLKPDPQTPVSGGVLFAQLFEQAGLPEGLLHVLPGGIPTAEAIVADPSVVPQGQICLTCRCPKLSPRARGRTPS